jgi:hypothetical protein
MNIQDLLNQSLKEMGMTNRIKDIQPFIDNGECLVGSVKISQFLSEDGTLATAYPAGSYSLTPKHDKVLFCLVRPTFGKDDLVQIEPMEEHIIAIVEPNPDWNPSIKSFEEQENYYKKNPEKFRGAIIPAVSTIKITFTQVGAQAYAKYLTFEEDLTMKIAAITKFQELLARVHNYAQALEVNLSYANPMANLLENYTANHLDGFEPNKFGALNEANHDRYCTCSGPTGCANRNKRCGNVEPLSIQEIENHREDLAQKDRANRPRNN